MPIKHDESLPHVAAHKHAIHNKAELLASNEAGCFFCLEKCKPLEIVEWADKSDDVRLGDTALCPHCGIDSLIGSASGYALTTSFLEQMNKYWFGSEYAEPW